jgi:hypothetical protein
MEGNYCPFFTTQCRQDCKFYTTHKDHCRLLLAMKDIEDLKIAVEELRRRN